MCDPYSLASGAVDMIGGLASGMDARTQGDVAAIQYRALAIGTQADGRRQQTAISRQFDEVAKMNRAFGAVTGLDLRSFDSIESGNREDQRRGLRQVAANTRSADNELAMRAQMAELEGRLAQKAARWAGLSSFVGKAVAADRNYLKYRFDGESRWDYAMRSMES